MDNLRSNRESERQPAATLPGGRELELIDAYWRACNYLAVGMIYLQDNPLLREPLTTEHVKHRLLGPLGSEPGAVVRLGAPEPADRPRRPRRDLRRRARSRRAGVLGPAYLEGTYSEIYPDKSEDLEGLRKFFKQFSFPGHIGSHVTPETPGSIHEGGELGYSLSHAYGMAFDNPDLIVACVVGDGEAETGPLATAWHSNKFLNPIRDGAVLPILNLNGYKIANPTILARISHEELESLFVGYGYTPYFVEGSDPASMHEQMAATLDRAVGAIRSAQQCGARLEHAGAPALAGDHPALAQGLDGAAGDQRAQGRRLVALAPGAVLRRARQPGESRRCSRAGCAATGPRSCSTPAARLLPELKALAPRGARRMSANPHANGGLLRKDSRAARLPDYAVPVPARGTVQHENTKPLGEFLRDVMRRQPDELPRVRAGRNRLEPAAGDLSRPPRRRGWPTCCRRTPTAASCHPTAA